MLQFKYIFKYNIIILNINCTYYYQIEIYPTSIINIQIYI